MILFSFGSLTTVIEQIAIPDYKPGMAITFFFRDILILPSSVTAAPCHLPRRGRLELRPFEGSRTLGEDCHDSVRTVSQ